MAQKKRGARHMPYPRSDHQVKIQMRRLCTFLFSNLDSVFLLWAGPIVRAYFPKG